MVVNCFNITGLKEKDYELFKMQVSKERRCKAERFRFKEDAYRSVCAELLLQYSLHENKRSFRDIDFTYNVYGKPKLKDINDFHFNMSHSGDWVVLAYGATEVGVDIEKIKSGLDGIADSVFTEKEYIYSVSGSERDRRIIEIWTLRESYIKYLGTGFSTQMDTFSIDAVNNIVYHANGKKVDKIYINSSVFKDDYYLAICSEEMEYTIREIQLEDIRDMIKRI